MACVSGHAGFFPFGNYTPTGENDTRLFIEYLRSLNGENLYSRNSVISMKSVLNYYRTAAKKNINTFY